MNILMISRGYPSKWDPQWGSFEKEQAIALKTLVTMLLLHMLTEESFVKIENGEYQRLMIMGLLFIVSIYFPSSAIFVFCYIIFYENIFSDIGRTYY